MMTTSEAARELVDLAPVYAPATLDELEAAAARCRAVIAGGGWGDDGNPTGWSAGERVGPAGGYESEGARTRAVLAEWNQLGEVGPDGATAADHLARRQVEWARSSLTRLAELISTYTARLSEYASAAANRSAARAALVDRLPPQLRGNGRADAETLCRTYLRRRETLLRQLRAGAAMPGAVAAFAVEYGEHP